MNVTGELRLVRDKMRRWQTRLTRAHNALVRLQAKERRLEKKLKEIRLHPPPLPPIKPAPVETSEAPAPAPAAATPTAAGIPDFLRRSPLTTEAKAIAEQEAEKKKTHAKAKAKARASVKVAKLTGATKRMPLSGKAALEFIKSQP